MKKIKDFITAIRLAFSPVRVLINESGNVRTTVYYKQVGATRIVLDIDYMPIDANQESMVIPDIDYLKLRIERRAK